VEYISRGYRFDEQVIAWLDGLKGVHGSYNKGLRLIAGLEKLPEPRPAEEVSAQFPNTCLHNSTHENGRKFMSDRRGITLCPACFILGHRGEPRNCQECTLGEGTGGL